MVPYESDGQDDRTNEQFVIGLHDFLLPAQNCASGAS